MILMAQLVVTFGMVAVFTLSKDVSTFALQTPALFYVALAGTLVCIIALSCCGNLRRRTPHNYIFLGIFTVSYPIVRYVATCTCSWLKSNASLCTWQKYNVIHRASCICRFDLSLLRTTMVSWSQVLLKGQFFPLN